MGVTERKEREFKRREEEILSAAFKLFVEKGLDGVSIEMIANAAEIGKGTIYKHFKSKQDILALLINKYVARLHQLFIEKNDTDASVIEQLRLFIRIHIDWYREDIDAYEICHKFMAVLSMDCLSAEVSHKYIEMFRTKMEPLNRIIQRGIDEGLFVDTPAKESALLFVGMFMGAIDMLSSPVIENPERLYEIIEAGLIKSLMR